MPCLRSASGREEERLHRRPLVLPHDRHELLADNLREKRAHRKPFVPVEVVEQKGQNAVRSSTSLGATLSPLKGAEGPRVGASSRLGAVPTPRSLRGREHLVRQLGSLTAGVGYDGATTCMHDVVDGVLSSEF